MANDDGKHSFFLVTKILYDFHQLQHQGYDWFTLRADCDDPKEENWKVNMLGNGAAESGGEQLFIFLIIGNTEQLIFVNQSFTKQFYVDKILIIFSIFRWRKLRRRLFM